jgi:pimeloyl-ACP methyl ester carboxylesterase
MRRLIVALAAIALLGAGTTTIEKFGKTRGAVALPSGAPIGSVILIPGGTTLQSVHDDGSSSNEGNFVMRVRRDFVAAGFAIAYLEDPSDLRPAIARMRAIARPVFLLGTSNGTSVEARVAATYGADGPDGVVFTSTVTRSGGKLGYSAASADIRRITVPVLFIHNRNDSCVASPPSAVAGLIARFAPGADVTRIDVASSELNGDPCEPFSPHGYEGIETDVVGKILTWMRAHGVPAVPR